MQTFDVRTDVVFAEETFEQSWPDAETLIHLHWKEIASYPDIPLDVDVEAYRRAEAAGLLCILTARVEGAMIGYVVFVLTPHLHYRTTVYAHQDVLYLHPAHRGRWMGAKMISLADHLLASKGVHVVTQHVKLTHPALGRLLERQGYTVVEHLYSKRLDRGA